MISGAGDVRLREMIAIAPARTTTAAIPLQRREARSPAPARSRIESIDLLRGAVMIRTGRCSGSWITVPGLPT